jgi:rubrerythrin
MGKLDWRRSRVRAILGASMLKQVRESSTVEDGFIPFFAAGTSTKGEFHCSDCGYGVTVFRALPRCPMCGGESWEQSTWSPFRAHLRRD